uniref:High mobility group nucleosome binding domain 1 n=1 Tax=Rhinopithecus bieti TaxID=61621 RepID=A0A2K6KWG8_RHIBE
MFEPNSAHTGGARCQWPEGAQDKSSDKKVQTKGKRGAKGKQAEVANQETKEDLPAENGETKTEESPASDEAGEKEAKSD